LVELLKKSEIEIVDIIVLAAKEENNGINLIYEKT
jgi:adenine/guanine phosphoribosyltransferase-like PRPP-binding protein